MNSTPLLDRMYVASPCTSDWNLMKGDERARFCSQCSLHVYDISAMSRAEAENLIGETGGKLCVRLYRRFDGTVITKDCPVGLRFWRRRVSRSAGAVLTAIMSIFSGSAIAARPGAIQGSPVVQDQLKLKRKKLKVQNRWSVLAGTVYDQNGAVIVNASVLLINERKKSECHVRTDEEGKFELPGVEAGTYSIKVESPGFSVYSKKLLKIDAGEQVSLDVVLKVGTLGRAAFLPIERVADRMASE